jgi:hypothetical protein
VRNVASATPSDDTAVFRREGNVWTVVFTPLLVH